MPFEGGATAPAAGEDRPRHCCRLSEDLEGLIGLTAGPSVTVGALLEHLALRGHALLVLFLALPFLQPLPLPGLSTPFGLAIALLGALMAAGRQPWLPRRLMTRELSSSLVARSVRGGQSLLRRVERFIRPRGVWYHRHRWARPIAGLVVAVSGLELALPLPILFTNTLPALVIATTAVGMLEEDGLFTTAGLLLFLAALVVFGVIVLLPFVGLRLLL